MPGAISDTSPLLYLHRIGALSWLEPLFGTVEVPRAVLQELDRGREKRVDVPDPTTFPWVLPVEPIAPPSEWLALDLGQGELAAMAFALENPDRVLLLDDALARRIGQAAGLQIWGTLRVLLEAKQRGLTDRIAPMVDRLAEAGLWISAEIRHRVLILADEAAREPG